MIDPEEQDKFISSLPPRANLEDMVKLMLAMALTYGVTAEEFKYMILGLNAVVANGEYDRVVANRPLQQDFTEGKL
jgi:hypothetical protein